MRTITLTHEQLDELYYAAGLLYMDYDEGQPADYNDYIRRYNNHIDELRQVLKESLKEKDETCKN